MLNLQDGRIIVCDHSHCGAIRAQYGEVPAAAQNLARWLEPGREASLPAAEPGPEVLCRTEQRAIVIQLERLMDYPMVRERVERGALTLHGWHHVIEDGEVHVFDAASGSLVSASQAEHAGTGPASWTRSAPAACPVFDESQDWRGSAGRGRAGCLPGFAPDQRQVRGPGLRCATRSRKETRPWLSSASSCPWTAAS